MTGKPWPFKDPDELLDYDIDWSDRLVTDTIVSSLWVASDAGISIVTDEVSTQATKVWLSGGTEGDQYLLTNTITTAAGRTMEQTGKLRIKSK